MNAVYGSSPASRAANSIGAVVGGCITALARGLGVVLFAILRTLEPLVRSVLSFGALGGFLTVGLFYFAGPPGLKVSYGILLTFSVGCAVALALYELVVDALAP